MAATYDANLPTDKDYVRFALGDTDVNPTTAADLMDEEIFAILEDEKNKYLAAARCGEIIIGKLKGLVSKNVDNLGISFGDSPTSSYRAHLQRLREDGANRLLSKNQVFRVL